MANHKMKFLAALTLAWMFAGSATAGTVWNEAVNGDLSNDPLAPTVLNFSSGQNFISGEAGGAVSGVPPFDQDFFNFLLLDRELVSLTAVSGVMHDPSDNEFFIGLGSGARITANTLPPFSDAAGLLGWQHVEPGDIGTNILPAMGTADFGATGFTAPLGAGLYSVWVQDDHPVDYILRFDVAPIPEPSTVPLMLTGLTALAGLRLHRRRAWLPSSR